MAPKTKPEPAAPDEVKTPDTDAAADTATGATNAGAESGDTTGAQNGETNTGTGDENSDADDSLKNGTVVPTGAEVSRKAVVFLGPHHRYSRGDTACFEAATAEALVKRGIAVWPKDSKRALSPRPGDNDNDTDVG